MKLIITFAFISLQYFAIGQIKRPTQQDVEKIICLAISQKISDKNKSCEYGQCGAWYTANCDSFFYRSDTVKFYNSRNIGNSDTNFCTSLVWDFKEENAFLTYQSNMCQEPSTITIRSAKFFSGQNSNAKNENRYKIASKGNWTYIITYVDKAIIETFKVIELTKTTQSNLGDESYVLTLVRIEI